MNRFLVDTHALLWWLDDAPALPAPARAARARLGGRGAAFHHRDPLDRLLIAQALQERIPILTLDERFVAYGVPLIS